MNKLTFSSQIIGFLNEGRIDLSGMTSLEESRKVPFLFEKVMDLVNSSASLPLLEKIKCSFQVVTPQLEEKLQKVAEKIIETAQSKLSSSHRNTPFIQEAITFLSKEIDFDVIRAYLDPLVKSGEVKHLIEALEDFIQRVDWSNPPNILLAAYDKLMKDEGFVREIVIHTDLGVLKYVSPELFKEEFILDLVERVPLSEDNLEWFDLFIRRNPKIDVNDFVEKLHIAQNKGITSRSEFVKLIEGGRIFWERQPNGGKVSCDYMQFLDEEFIFSGIPDFISKLFPDLLRIDVAVDTVTIEGGFEKKLNLKVVNSEYGSFQRERKDEISKLKTLFKSLIDSVNKGNLDVSLIGEINSSNFEKLFGMKLNAENTVSLPALEKCLSEIQSSLSQVKATINLSTVLSGFFALSGGEYTVKVPENIKFDRTRKIEGIDVIDRIIISDTTDVVIKANEKANLLKLKGIEFKNGELNAINLTSDRLQFIIDSARRLNTSKHEEGWLLV